ncbi:MAG: hypothetical protein JWL86_1427 [Rhizobium sp.]|nr:hypothetical protein [Rhizobium sp.]
MKYNKNLVDMVHELERDRRTVHREYSASLMSSTKWRVLMKAVDDAGVKQMIVKFIDNDREYTTAGFDLDVPYQYADVVSGSRPLISVEWIEFPKVAIFPRSNNLPADQIPQDLDAIRAVIHATGKRYLLEETDRGFRVIGHVPKVQSY